MGTCLPQTFPSTTPGTSILDCMNGAIAQIFETGQPRRFFKHDGKNTCSYAFTCTDTSTAAAGGSVYRLNAVHFTPSVIFGKGMTLGDSDANNIPRIGNSVTIETFRLSTEWYTEFNLNGSMLDKFDIESLNDVFGNLRSFSKSVVIQNMPSGHFQLDKCASISGKLQISPNSRAGFSVALPNLESIGESYIVRNNIGLACASLPKFQRFTRSSSYATESSIFVPTAKPRILVEGNVGFTYISLPSFQYDAVVVVANNQGLNTVHFSHWSGDTFYLVNNKGIERACLSVFEKKIEYEYIVTGNELPESSKFNHIQFYPEPSIGIVESLEVPHHQCTCGEFVRCSCTTKIDFEGGQKTCALPDKQEQLIERRLKARNVFERKFEPSLDNYEFMELLSKVTNKQEKFSEGRVLGHAGSANYGKYQKGSHKLGNGFDWTLSFFSDKECKDEMYKMGSMYGCNGVVVVMPDVMHAKSEVEEGDYSNGLYIDAACQNKEWKMKAMGSNKECSATSTNQQIPYFNVSYEVGKCVAVDQLFIRADVVECGIGVPSRCPQSNFVKPNELLPFVVTFPLLFLFFSGLFTCVHWRELKKANAKTKHPLQWSFTNAFCSCSAVFGFMVVLVVFLSIVTRYNSNGARLGRYTLQIGLLIIGPILCISGIVSCCCCCHWRGAKQKHCLVRLHQ